MKAIFWYRIPVHKQRRGLL